MSTELGARLCSGVLLEVQRTIERLLQLNGATASGPRRLLDVGCWDGGATLRYASVIGARAAGIEVFETPAAQAAARGIEVARADIERESFPWPEASFDVVIMNQVLEHLKNVWWAMSEAHRVLKPGGTLIVSVPNLASLHNRLLLALGVQPSSIRTFGPHVRGFARSEFERFVAHGGALRIERSIGVGFYPLQGSWGNPLARLWPGASHTAVIQAGKTANGPAPWLAELTAAGDGAMQTLYGSSGNAGDVRLRRGAG